MAETKFGAREDAVTILSTELNSLADGGNKVTTSAVDNASAGQRFLFADFELVLGVAGAARDNYASVAMYFLSSIDGTNFTFGGDSTDPPPGALVRSFTLDPTGVTAAKRVVIEQVPLPNANFHILLENRTGEAFNASGNTLKMRRYTYTSG